MLSYLQAILLGLLQGFSELFPISSLGHTVIIPRLLGWNIDQGSEGFVSFVVLTHLATAIVLLGFFWRDWLLIVSGMLKSIARREIRADDIHARIGWLLVVGTIPAGILGLLFEERLKSLFAAADIVAIVLVLNGAALLLFEAFGPKARAEGAHDDGQLAALSWGQAIGIGMFQCFALIPGFSRTGFTIAGGLLAGRLSHENSARFAFLLATPIIFAAALLKVPEIFTSGASIGPPIAGALCAAVTAYLSVKFLLRYFETRTMRPFAIYCIVAGLASFLLLRF